MLNYHIDGKAALPRSTRLHERLNDLIVILKEWRTLGRCMCVEREREYDDTGHSVRTRQ
jgi:hypothetical protein